MLIFIISDVLVVGIFNNLFWLTLLVIAVIVFHKELRGALASLGSLNIGGASFKFKDQKKRLESYGMLTDILVEVLSQRDSAEQLVPYISYNSARQLAKFTIEYEKEVPEKDRDADLLKNVALIAGRKGNTKQAISLYDALLKKAPADRDLLNLKALMLFNTGDAENISAAEVIYDDLVKKYPEEGLPWFNRGIVKSLAGKHDESIDSLNKAIACGYGEGNPRMLEDSGLRSLRRLRPTEFKKLIERLENAPEHRAS